MNYRWDKKYLYWGVTIFCVVACSILFYTCVTNFTGVMALIGKFLDLFTPVIYGFVLAYLLSPIMNYFEKKWFRALFYKIEKKRIAKGKTRTPAQAEVHEFNIRKKSRALGVAATFFVALVFLIGLVSAVLPQILESVTTLANNTNFYIERIQEWDLSFLNGLPEVQGLVSDFINDAPTQITLWLQENVLPEMNSLVVSVGGGIWSTIGALFDIILGLFVSIYLLYGKELFAAQGKKVLYATAPVHTANVVVKSMRDIHKKFGGFITGKLIDSMIVGALFFVTLTIFNIPYPVLISVVLGITNIIPFFGPFIGAIPASLLILMVDPMKCLYFIIIVLIIQQIDGNWLGPKIVGDSIGLSSFWVIFAIVVGQRLFGFIGLVVGIPIFSFLYALAKARVTRILEKKELPSDSDFYRKVSHLDSETGEFVLFDESEKPKKAKEKKKFNFFMKKKG